MRDYSYHTGRDLLEGVDCVWPPGGGGGGGGGESSLGLEEEEYRSST